MAFLGPAAHTPASTGSVSGAAAVVATTSGLDVAVQQWLTEGRPVHPAWLVPDEDSPAGTAVDVAAWWAH